MKFRSALAFLAVAAFAGAAQPVMAGENCTCRGNGQDIPEGQTVCLKTASGSKLARCERVLNNTSWKIMDQDCPIAELPRQSVWITARTG